MLCAAAAIIRKKERSWLKNGPVQHVLPYKGRIGIPRYYSPHPARDRYSYSPSGSDALSYGRTGRGEYSIVTGHFLDKSGESGSGHTSPWGTVKAHGNVHPSWQPLTGGAFVDSYLFSTIITTIYSSFQVRSGEPNKALEASTSYVNPFWSTSILRDVHEPSPSFCSSASSSLSLNTNSTQNTIRSIVPSMDGSHTPHPPLF
jgi:hypothetical protein